MIIESQWFEHLKAELEKSYMVELSEFLRSQKAQGKVIYPPVSEIFSAFNSTPISQVKVVVLGQDPYHGEHQAHGLSFSVPVGTKTPPSLLNIYKELVDDVAITMPSHGDLTSWAEQGVLLLNSVLTVEQGNAGSHQGKGWEEFTDHAIAVLNEHCQNLVFMLWGAYAQKKGAMIDRHKHLVLQAPHPSPLSAHRGFLGCKHFSQANAYLVDNGGTAINWQV